MIHHALKGPALHFYHESIHGKVTQMGEVFKILENKFLSESVKLGIRTKMLSLRLSQIQKKDDLTKLEAIDVAKRQIYSLSQQGQTEYRTDAAMIDVIEKNVLQGKQWSTEIATRRATPNFSFDEYCSALTTWIRATVEKSGVCNAHGYFGKSSEATSAGAPPTLINYGEQYSDSAV
jgi:DNA-binding HxlR family transcriptional regulator